MYCGCLLTKTKVVESKRLRYNVNSKYNYIVLVNVKFVLRDLRQMKGLRYLAQRGKCYGAKRIHQIRRVNLQEQKLA